MFIFEDKNYRFTMEVYLNKVIIYCTTLGTFRFYSKSCRQVYDIINNQIAWKIRQFSDIRMSEILTTEARSYFDRIIKLKSFL